MLRIGLTGGIASGKTTVRRVFERCGIPMLDADGLTHHFVGPGGELVPAILRTFGTGVRSADGGVDRKKLGALVFSKEQERRWLNRLVHPRIHQEIRSFLDLAEQQGEAAAGVEAALMIETGSAALYDRVVVVFCEPEQQFERLVARSGMNPGEARLRLAAQLPPEQKAARGTDVLDATGTVEETEARAAALAARLLAAAPTHGAPVSTGSGLPPR